MKLTPPVGGTRPEVTSPRCGSPLVGCSILITSAPQSASTAPAAGTNHHCATSRTRMPSITPVMDGGVPRVWGSAEFRVRTLLALTVDEHVDLLVVEADHPGHLGGLGKWR